MISLCKALQISAAREERTCPAWEKDTFQTPQGVLKHLSQFKRCQWYRKGKLQDLGQAQEEPESPEPIVTHPSAPFGDEPQEPKEPEEDQPLEDVMADLDHEFYNLIPPRPLLLLRRLQGVSQKMKTSQ
jgi:hypothetical protein